MTIYFMADTATGENRGIYSGPTLPAGMTDTGLQPEDGRMVWSGSAWELPSAVKEADERSWRDGELRATDFWGLSDQTMIAGMVTYRQELRDLPELAGFPDTHTRPTGP